MDRIETSVQYRDTTLTPKDIWAVPSSLFSPNPVAILVHTFPVKVFCCRKHSCCVLHSANEHGGLALWNNLSSVKRVAKISLKKAVKLDETVGIDVSHVSQGSQFAD